MGAEFTITSFAREIKEAVEATSLAALEALGIQAERNVVLSITNVGAVDTGLLRNSITYAIAGKPPAKKWYEADRGKGDGVVVGEYKGVAPEGGFFKRKLGIQDLSVYVGTNVYYAPYVEYGTYRMAARHYMVHGIEDHQDEYLAIIKYFLENPVSPPEGNGEETVIKETTRPRQITGTPKGE